MKTLTALLALLVLAGPASAARVSVQVGPEPTGIREDISDSDQFVLFRAGRGERNRVRVRKLENHVAIVSDPGARVRAGRGCRRLSRHAVRCRFDADYYSERFVARLGDRADRSRRPRGPIGVELSGGHGDDVLLGGELNDVLRGGTGGDILVGRRGYDLLSGDNGADELVGGRGADDLADGPGTDLLRGGDGRDTLRSADPASRDGIRGGDGRDTVSYASRRKPVTIALSSGTGEDDVVDVENVLGGLGADVITGDARANDIDTYGIGDVVDAGAGNDAVRAYYAEDVTCGDGSDAVTAFVTEAPLLRPDCERIGGSGPAIPAQPAAVTTDTVTLSLPCTAQATPITLVTAPVARPWYPTGPFNTVVAGGTTRAGGTAPTVELCPVTLTVGDEGRSLPRPLPVIVHGSYSTWAFLLAAPAATAR